MIITKADLLKAMETERQKLDKVLAGVTDDQMLRPGTLGEWAIKDVLTHLIGWEQMFMGWLEAGRRGETPKLPAPGFNWAQLPALNNQIYQQHKDQSLAEIRAEFAASYECIGNALREAPEDELYTRQRYVWLGDKWTVGRYAESATSAHYRWAVKEIRKALRTLQEN
jgi:uncharacterized protein (TIGR03083 family)